MTYKEELEAKCAVLFEGETDPKRRFAILKDAFWQARHAGYCDAMAGRLMGGRSDSQTDYWEEACRLKYEVEALCKIYNAELGDDA